MNSEEQFSRVCEPRFEGIAADLAEILKNDNERHKVVIHKLDKLDESIRGNGVPGLNMRVDRLERIAKTVRYGGGALFVTTLGTLAKVLFF